jgi:hypothetical protein
MPDTGSLGLIRAGDRVLDDWYLMKSVDPVRWSRGVGPPRCEPIVQDLLLKNNLNNSENSLVPCDFIKTPLNIFKTMF